MKRIPFALAALLAPSQALAHDAFGDLGPFYASFLHPVVDPLQAALLTGAAALLARRPETEVRLALPLFIFAGVIAYLANTGIDYAVLPVIAAFVAMIVGSAAALPQNFLPGWIVLGVVTLAGAIAGLLPDPLPDALGGILPHLGTILGLAVLTTLAWITLDAAARRFTALVPAITGSWVAALSIFVVALTA
ncbi:hypothetical protein ACFORG_22170 [Lutimaribacter marinistellae]|uniref:HupE / UreJ protein n=1 Tax=Lutimaribacter marinistellae TaxID=1820329 RepID=A0ABV7TNY9_9RHOB